MGKVFEVEGIPKAVILYKGLMLKPNVKFKVNMNENEFNCFKDYIEIIDISELGVSKSVEVEAQETAFISQEQQPTNKDNQEQEVKKDDKPRVRTNSKNKK